jgi:hypothetical protein
MLGNANGTFQPAVTYSSGGSYNSIPVVADLNGDHKLDLVVPNSYCNLPKSVGCIAVVLGNGDGTLQPPVIYGANSGLMWAAVADFNGDGIPDVAFVVQHTAAMSTYVGMLVGNGDGTFQPTQEFDTGGFDSTWVAAVDLNGDGRPDLLVENPNTGSDFSLGVLINSTFQSSTTTTLTSSLNPSVYGQSVTFTATVKSSAGTPPGTVQILYGSTVVGTGTLASGKASIPVSSLPAGSDSVTASYLGGGGFASSTSGPLTEVVNKAATSTTVTSSLNPGGIGQPITYTATVTSQYGGAATGSVTFTSNSQTLGTASLSGNTASLTTSFSSSGTYIITAKYSGDSNNIASTSANLSQTIIASTTTTLTSSLNPSTVGQAVTFKATVSSSSGTPPNGEIVTFKNGSAVLGTGAINAGVAMLTISSLTAGSHSITANYPGDSNFAASTSPVLTQVVNLATKSATSTTLASSLNPSTYGQTVTWTAKVTTSGPVPPTGSVKFTWSVYTIGSATLNSSGVATLTKSTLNVYTYPLTATYSGDTNNLGSASPVVNQAVQQTTSAATLTSSPNPSTSGQSVTFTAKITSPTVTPTGPVTFTAGNTVLGSAQLIGGKALFTTSTLAVGSTTVTATYAGSSNISGSSASVVQVVNQ